MRDQQPPRVATWLAQRLVSGPRRESLLGDLIEQYRQGRSGIWDWRQVLAAILVGTAARSCRSQDAGPSDLDDRMDPLLSVFLPGDLGWRHC